MKTCNCFCSIIPPHIVDELVKKGKIVKESVEYDSSFRVKRQHVIQMLTEAVRTASMTAALTSVTPVSKRLVYDCQHTINLRTNLKRSEGGAPVADTIVNNAYDNSGIVREFYRTQYAYNFVGDGHGYVILNIHYSNRFNNAFWNGTEMIFGDGDGVIFTNFVKSLDVTGHEMTHGVVQYTAGLIYDGQPGALNEHIADVFGVTIRQQNQNQTSNPATANWLIGDSIMGPTLHGQAIRSMKAPGTAYNNALMGRDPQPDNMRHYFTGSADNHGVHINSGIPNKVFYLVSVGIHDTLKAALLWFETLKTLRGNDNFANFKTKLLAQALRLQTSHQVPANTHTVAEQAFAAVGL